MCGPDYSPIDIKIIDTNKEFDEVSLNIYTRLDQKAPELSFFFFKPI